MATSSGSQAINVLEMENELRRLENQRPRVISRRNKAVAAISSAAVTSLLMTPFDVIKTRMQTQEAPSPLFQPSQSSKGVTCCQTSIQDSGVLCRFDPRMDTKLSTSSSSKGKARATNNYTKASTRPRVVPQSTPLTPAANHMSGAACVYPDKQVAAKELQQLQNSGRLSGVWDGVVKVGRAEGARGLWRGLTPTLVMTVPSQLTYMTCYDIFRAAILSMDSNPITTSSSPSMSNISSHTMFASLCAGALARSVSATLYTPIELIRTRLQASSSTTSHGLMSMFSDLHAEVKVRGPRVLFRGLVPTLYRDVPFSALYFTGYESMKRILTGAGFGERNADSVQRKDFAVAFFSGATSGTVAAIVTQPFDLIKTRLQAMDEQAKASSRSTTRTTLQMGRDIAAREGMKGLFRGLSPRVAKVAPACGVMISSFEIIARWLDEM